MKRLGLKSEKRLGLGPNNSDMTTRAKTPGTKTRIKRPGNRSPTRIDSDKNSDTPTRTNKLDSSKEDCPASGPSRRSRHIRVLLSEGPETTRTTHNPDMTTRIKRPGKWPGQAPGGSPTQTDSDRPGLSRSVPGFGRSSRKSRARVGFLAALSESEARIKRSAPSPSQEAENPAGRRAGRRAGGPAGRLETDKTMIRAGCTKNADTRRHTHTSQTHKHRHTHVRTQTHTHTPRPCSAHRRSGAGPAPGPDITAYHVTLRSDRRDSFDWIGMITSIRSAIRSYIMSRFDQIGTITPPMLATRQRSSTHVSGPVAFRAKRR